MKNILLTLLLFPLLVSGQIQLQSSFEAALPTGWQGATNRNYSPFALIEGSETWSHAIQSTIKRSGSSAWRMEVRPGDRSVPFGSYRAEITLTSKGTAQTYQPTAFRMSTYVPSGTWANSTLPECFPFQLHPQHATFSGGSACLYIEVKNGQYNARIIHSNEDANPGATEVITTVPIGPVERDVWVDWVVYYDGKKTTDGRIIIWRKVMGVDSDYRKVIDYTGRTLHYWSLWPYLKTGIYWWNRPASGAANMARVGYIDMVAFGKATEATALDMFRLDGPPPPPPNVPPTANAGSNQSLPGGTTSTTLTGTDGDTDGTISTRSWTRISGPNTPTIVSASSATTNVTGLVTGTYVFQYEVTDNSGGTAQSTMSVSIAASNQAPVVPPMTPISRPAGSTTANLDGEATDAEDAVITNRIWAQLSGPTSATFSPNVNDWNPVVGNLSAGSYVFRLTVTDSQGATASNTVSVTVAAANQPPVVTPASPIIVVRSTTSSSAVNVSATDPEGGSLTYLWVQTSGPNTSTITNGNTNSPTVSNLTIGYYIYQCTVTDNSGGSTTAQVSLRVNKPPVITIDPTLLTSFPNGTTSIPLNGSAVDDDGTITQYRWKLLTGFGTFSDSTAANNTFTPRSSGSYTLVLSAVDNDDEQDGQTYSFTIEGTILTQKHGLRRRLP